MAESHHRQFEELLFAYELGILSDEERRRLELHLLECDDCMEKIKEFNKASKLIKLDSRTRETINQIAGQKPQEHVGTAATAQFWRRFVPAVTAAAILLLLILQPWQIAIQPTREAMASSNRLVIMYFENLAEPEDTGKLGKIITNLLITDLSESPLVQVVSAQRLYDILKFMGEEKVAAINQDLATQVAKRSGARWMLTGSILQRQPQIVITSQLVEISSGEVIASQRISGEAGDNIFAIADKLSKEIKDDLALPPGADKDFDPVVSSITTSSREAYSFYIEGIEDYYKGYYQEAAESFEKALDYDSTFAMAYYSLAITKDRSYLNDAIKYADNTTKKEFYYIKAMEALVDGNTDSAMVLYYKLVKRYPDEKEAYVSLARLSSKKSEFRQAITYYEKAIELDSLYKSAYNDLAYTYYRINDLERALETIDKYIEIAPEESKPYDSKADLLAASGRPDEAAVWFKKALEKKEDFYSSLLGLGNLMLFKRDFASAEKYFRKLMASKFYEIRSEGRCLLSIIPIYQGRFNDALRVLDDGIAADRLEDYQGWNLAKKYLIKSLIFMELTKYNQSLQALDECMRIHSQVYPGEKVSSRHLYVEILARAGEYERARENVLLLKEGLMENNMEMTYYYYAEGAIESARGNYDKAISYFKKAGELTKDFNIHYNLGRT